MRSRIVHGGGIFLGLALAIPLWLALGAMQMACSTPPEVRPFPPFPEYTEKFADSTEVDDNCYTPGGKHDDGTRQKWNDNFCGCVDHVTKTVWIARRIECDLDAVRAHENFHIQHRHLKGKARDESRKECARRFPSRVF